MGPLVSIILTSYNQPELLEVAFDSLIKQTYKNIEIIIVDDFSTDPLNRFLILKFHLEHHNIVRYIFHEKNIGISANRNSGFRIAKGSFISYLDGDDFYFPEKIENEIALFTKQPDLDVVYSNFIFAEPSGKLLQPWAINKMPSGNIFKWIVKEDFPNSILYRYELIKCNVILKHSYYDEELCIYEDWDFRIRYSVDSKVGYVDKVLSVYRRTSKSITITSGLSKIITQRRIVIEKNKLLIESHDELKGCYEKFNKQFLKDTLFDTQVSLFKHLSLSFKFLLNYPTNFRTVWKALKYFIYIKMNKWFRYKVITIY